MDKQGWYISGMEDTPAFKGKQILTAGTTWTDLENMLRDINQTQDKYCMIPLTGCT